MAAIRNPCTKTTMVSIPNEIITDEILPKLPAKSLVRFKCVSKSFNTFISSSEFIDIHLQQSLSSSANRLLILAEKDCSHLYSFDIDSSDCDTCTAIKIPLPRTLGRWLDDGVVSIVGSFNGLLCVGLKRDIDGTDEYTQVVINPSTGIFREVPRKHTPRLRNEYRVSFGFGFDDINNDYKLVRVAENANHYDPYGGDELCNREVTVYSLNENTWKFVENVRRPTHSMQMGQNGVLLNNHLLHWVFKEPISNYNIYCFDVRSNRWTNDVPLVDDLFTDSIADFHEEYKDVVVDVLYLGVVDGCLCFSAISNLSDVIWIMKEYGVKESWMKLFEIYHCPSRCLCCYHFCGTYGFRQGSTQEVLVRQRWTSPELFWHNIGFKANGKTEKISGTIPVSRQFCFFTGSLVPIPGSKPIISPED